MVWDFPLLMLKRSPVLEDFAFDDFFGDVQPAIPNNWASWMLSFCLLCLVGVVTDERSPGGTASLNLLSLSAALAPGSC